MVLAVNGLRDQNRGREYLYVGLSRARSCLVVCGDLDQISAVGETGLRRRLEASTQSPHNAMPSPAVRHEEPGEGIAASRTRATGGNVATIRAATIAAIKDADRFILLILFRLGSRIIPLDR